MRFSTVLNCNHINYNGCVIIQKSVYTNNSQRYDSVLIQEFIRPFPNTVFERHKPHLHTGGPRACSRTLLEGAVKINFARPRGLYQTFALAFAQVRITQILPVREANRLPEEKNMFRCVCRTTNNFTKH